MRLLLVLLFVATTLMGCGDQAEKDEEKLAASSASKLQSSGSAFNGDVNVMHALSQNRMVMAGNFTQHNNVNVGRMAIIESDGSLNSAFAQNLGAGFNGAVKAVLPLESGGFIVGGDFSELKGQPARNLAKVNADGSIDMAFNASLGSGFNGVVNDIKLDKAGGMIIVGHFTLFNAKEARRYHKLPLPPGGAE